MQLEPCPSCKRHVRTDETVCPFCAAEIRGALANAPTRAQPLQRLGRAALLTFGLTASASALVACDDDAPSDTDDASIVQPVYGAPVPPEDAGTLDAGSKDASVKDASTDAATPADAGTDAAVNAGADAGQDAGHDSGPHVVPLYGAPAQTN